ncbi:MAG: flavodoxin family protein [Clostridia bacterium]|nr:flavodoxin family protein [Clostridia bacterium]
MKTLVVYYSRKGNTEKIALEKAKELEADFLAIDTTENVAGYNGFTNCLKTLFSKDDMALFPYDTDVASYDKVIICAPVWFSKLCAPMQTFIKKEKHNIRDAEYIFVHALKTDVKAIAAETDRILRLKNSKYTSIQCIYGKIKTEEEFGNV